MRLRWRATNDKLTPEKQIGAVLQGVLGGEAMPELIQNASPSSFHCWRELHIGVAAV